MFNNENPVSFDTWHSSTTEVLPTANPVNSNQHTTEWVDEADEEAEDLPIYGQRQLNAIGLPIGDDGSHENDEDSDEDPADFPSTLDTENPKIHINSLIDEDGFGPEPESEDEVEVEEVNERLYTIADGPTTEHSEICDFHIALMVFVTSCDISQTQYTGLREVLQLASLDAIASLPQTLSTLKSRIRRNIPLQKIRSYPIPVQLSKLRPKAQSPCPVYRFELLEYCRLWLANPAICKAMHFGLGVITSDRSRTEFYHGDAWLGSVRTTSGEFAFITDHVTDQSPMEPLFPSDCVIFHDPASPVLEVIGRVSGIAVDQRINAPVAVIQRLLPVGELPSGWRLNWPQLVQQAYDISATKGVPLPAHPRMEDKNIILPELVLMEDERLIIPVDNIIQKVYVYFLDYETPPAALLPHKMTYCVRYIAFKQQSCLVRRVDQRHRLPAELELIHFGRDYVIKKFVQPNRNTSNTISDAGSINRRISLPFTLFLDAFGLFKNAYCSIDGLYINPASLSKDSRHKLHNWFVLMYGPFGSHTTDMVETLADEMPSLEKGIRLMMPDTGEEVILTAFPLCILGDMPQQNANAGIRSHKSKLGCRYCFVSDVDRGSITIPFAGIGRYMPITEDLRHQNHTEAALNRFGLLPDGFAFGKNVFQLLDPHTAFPNDAMHCELRLAKYLHTALMEEIFTTSGCDAYSNAWQHMNVPYGW